jgi:hypothetical protein
VNALTIEITSYTLHSVYKAFLFLRIFRRNVLESIVDELMQYEDFFLRCAEREGPYMALFYTCVSANIPFVVSDLPEPGSDTAAYWSVYVRNVAANGDDKKGGRDAEWLDGITDIRWAFGKKLDKEDFAAAISAEKDRLSKLPGTQQQRDRWGRKGGGDAFTAADYARMDTMLDACAADYRSTGLSQRKEQSLIRYVKELFLADKANEDGDYKGAQAHYKNADMILAGEGMRAKDEKPMEGFRFDACIDALERAGLMRDGHFKSFEDTARAIWAVVHPEGNPRYGFSLDVADQILLNWENNMRKNSAQAEVFELPAEMELHDDYGEFLPEEAEEEIALKQQMDLSRVRYKKAAENHA